MKDSINEAEFADKMDSLIFNRFTGRPGLAWESDTYGFTQPEQSSNNNLLKRTNRFVTLKEFHVITNNSRTIPGLSNFQGL